MSDNDLIKAAQDGVFKSLKEIFKCISNDDDYLENNVSRRIKKWVLFLGEVFIVMINTYFNYVL